MIINELSEAELEALLLPFFHIEPKEERNKVLKDVLQYDFESYSDLSKQRKIRFCYAGFDLQFFVSDDELYLSFTKNCLLPIWYSRRGPIRTLQDFCQREISGLRFERLNVKASVPSDRNSWFNEMASSTLYIEPRNVDIDVIKKDSLLYASPTVICFFERQGMAHIELCFRPSGYRRTNGSTLRI